jgi:uncharacterized membrane protein
LTSDASNLATPAYEAQFVLRRNCSLSPRALLLVFGSMVALASCFGAAFAALGAWMILPFAGIELLALGVAFLVYGMHATDGDRVLLTGDSLIVEVVDGGVTRVHEFDPRWVRLTVRQAAGVPRLYLAGRGRELEIGRHLCWQRRAGFERDFREALRARRGHVKIFQND